MQDMGMFKMQLNCYKLLIFFRCMMYFHAKIASYMIFDLEGRMCSKINDLLIETMCHEINDPKFVQ